MLSFTVSTPCIIESANYYRYDIDLRLYTKSINPGPFTQTRKFQFMSWLATGAHNSGFNSLNYCIDYSLINYTGVGNLSVYNGLNAMAYGYPYNNYNLNKITPNNMFIWKNSFDYITFFATSQFDIEAIIIDFL